MQGVAWPGSAQRKRRILVWCGSVGGGVSLQCGVCGVARSVLVGTGVTSCVLVSSGVAWVQVAYLEAQVLFGDLFGRCPRQVV